MKMSFNLARGEAEGRGCLCAVTGDMSGGRVMAGGVAGGG